MRFMFMVKTAHQGPPTPELMAAIDELAGREIEAGRLIDQGGLLPPAMGAEIQVKDGKVSVLDGPFAESKEVVGGYAVFELPGREEAIASALEFMELHRRFAPGWEGICEMRPMASSGG
jgi:hypothetical protein